MAALPYMPLYVADYLADAAHLTATGHGVYLLLIMTYWQRGKPLPDDDRKLARIARVTDDEWADLRDEIAEFFTIEGGLWTHGRIDEELERVRAKSEQASEAGKASARRRFSKKLQHVKQASNDRSTGAQQTFNHTDTDTDIVSSLRSETTRARARERAFWPNDAKEAFWAKYPHKVGKGAAMKSFDRIAKRPDRPPFSEIMAGLDRYIREKPPDRPWCNPATWLNQERWSDVPADSKIQAPNARPPANRSRMAAFAAGLLGLDAECLGDDALRSDDLRGRDQRREAGDSGSSQAILDDCAYTRLDGGSGENGRDDELDALAGWDRGRS